MEKINKKYHQLRVLVIVFRFFLLTLRLKKCQPMEQNNINRIKVVLAEKNIKSRWLAEQLGKDEATVSKWCTNRIQPNLEMLRKIADTLDVDVKDLLWSSKN